MFSMKHLIYIIIIILLSLTICHIKYNDIEEDNIKYIYKTDTIVRVDTIIKEKPIPIYVKSEPDTIYIPSIDTVVAVDKETKVYKDSTYEVQISGIQPFLDKITVYPRETTVYKEKTLEIKEKKRFTQGFQVGLGYGLMNNKADVYIGYGFQYNF